MRCKPDNNRQPGLQIEVVGAKEPRPNAWTDALSYLADCLVELLRYRQAEFPIGSAINQTRLSEGRSLCKERKSDR